MKVEQFIKYYKPEMSEFCPVIVWRDGNVFDSSAGHMQMLRSLTAEAVMDSIPSDVSPMLYLVAYHKCVLVDYENQIYIEDMTKEQEEALNRLIEAGLIADHRVRMSYESIKI